MLRNIFRLYILNRLFGSRGGVRGRGGMGCGCLGLVVVIILLVVLLRACGSGLDPAGYGF